MIEIVEPIAYSYARAFPWADPDDLRQEGYRAMLESIQLGNHISQQKKAIRRSLLAFVHFNRSPVIHRHRPARVRAFTSVPLHERDWVCEETPEQATHLALWRVRVRSRASKVAGNDLAIAEPILLEEATYQEMAQLLDCPVRTVHLAVRRTRKAIRKTRMLQRALEEL